MDTILINDDVDTLYIKGTCDKCGNIDEKFVVRSQLVNEKQNMLICPKCGSNEVEIIERDIVDFLADASLDSSANVEVISSKTEDGIDDQELWRHFRYFEIQGLTWHNRRNRNIQGRK